MLVHFPACLICATSDFVQGIWSGMIGGICLQTIILIVITSITNWNTEVRILTLQNFPFKIFYPKINSLYSNKFCRLKKQRAE